MRLASPCIVYCIFKSYLTPTPKDYCNLSIYHRNMCRYLFSYKKKVKKMKIRRYSDQEASVISTFNTIGTNSHIY